MLQSKTVLCPNCQKKLQAIKRFQRWFSWCFDCGVERELVMLEDGTLRNINE